MGYRKYVNINKDYLIYLHGQLITQRSNSITIKDKQVKLKFNYKKISNKP